MEVGMDRRGVVDVGPEEGRIENVVVEGWYLCKVVGNGSGGWTSQAHLPVQWVRGPPQVFRNWEPARVQPRPPPRPQAQLVG